MKGLILKDIYCLRTKLFSFIVSSLATLILGTLVFVSMEHGNLKDTIGVVDTSLIGQEVSGDIVANEISGNATENTLFLTFIVCVILILPISLAADAMSCFAMDEKAEFSKLLLSMPASPYEMVGARFIVVYGYSFMCYLVSVLTCLIISGFTDLIDLITLLQWSNTFYSVMLVGIGVFMCVFYLVGTKKIELIATMGVIGAVILAMIVMSDKLTTQTNNLSKLLETITNFFGKCYQWLFPAALVLSVGFYYICVQIFKKRKGEVL